MITTTTGYDTAVVANPRQTSAFVEFEILDVSAASDASATVTSEEDFSKKDQIYNGIRQMSAKYATSENDYLLLDGSFTLPPKSTESGYEIGWWSDALSQADKTYAVSQVCTTNFTSDHTSIGLTITFDTLTDEYAEDFTIVFKDSSAVTLHTENVTGNTDSKYVLEQSVTDYRQVIITITKWKTAYRRARITEIDFGIVQEYTDTEIVRLNIVEEVNVISSKIPANELKLVLENSSKAFNILNPTGIYPYLQRRQKLIPYLGVVVTDSYTEYIPMGVYYLTQWKSDDGALTATFEARDILDILEQDTFDETNYSSKTLTYIAEDILSDAGITDYNIDSALDSITVSGTLPEATHKVSLQTVCIAGQAVMYSDREGTLQIKQLTTPTSSLTLDYANVYSAPLIKLEKLINTIYVTYGASTYTLTDPAKPSGEEVLAVTVDNPLIDTLSLAQDVGAWILAELKKRFLYEVRWRQNPALEISDIVTIEDDFSEDKTARITKNEFNYAGYLAGKTYAKGDGT